MADLATLQRYLDEAIAARHALNTGTQAQSVNTPAGGAVTYTPATAASLDAYIARLQSEIAAAQGSPRRPVLMSW